jgi:hypothetical protein
MWWASGVVLGIFVRAFLTRGSKATVFVERVRIHDADYGNINFHHSLNLARKCSFKGHKWFANTSRIVYFLNKGGGRIYTLKVIKICFLF